MNTWWGRMLIGTSAALICAISGLVVITNFNHDLFVALPCIPICLASFWVYFRARLRAMDENSQKSN
jgi:hypothetical protein